MRVYGTCLWCLAIQDVSDVPVHLGDGYCGQCGRRFMDEKGRFRIEVGARESPPAGRIYQPIFRSLEGGGL